MMESPLKAKVHVAGRWADATDDAETFLVRRPETGDALWSYPVSSWAALNEALGAGREAYEEIQALPPEIWARFLRAFADQIESMGSQICKTAALETGLEEESRFRSIELPRTVGQLRQAASAALTRAWMAPTLDPQNRVASQYESLPGVIFTIGPNNFPLAFNAVSGGDAAAAFATGHPVLAKGHPSHPATTELLAQCGVAAAEEAEMPPATLQVIYDVRPEDGYAVVRDARTAATAFTGSRAVGLKLAEVGHQAGRQVYAEMGSSNPAIVMPGAAGRAGLADALAGSVLLGGGQFCTKPGLICIPSTAAGGDLQAALADRIGASASPVLLSKGVSQGMDERAQALKVAGAQLIAEGNQDESEGARGRARLYSVDAVDFLQDAETFSAEAFGALASVVAYDGIDELLQVIGEVPGSLVASIFSDASNEQDSISFSRVVDRLRGRVGRIAYNKPSTGVAVSPAMNHGGPYPSTAHPGFTAVGIPRSMLRFAHLQCYDGFEGAELPPTLRPENPLGVQRFVNDRWTADKVTWGQNT